MNEHIKYLKYVEEQCLRCHSCRCYHSTSKIGLFCYGELATLLLNDKINEFPKSVFGCHECGLCLKKCPRHFNAKEFMFHARAYLESKDENYCHCYNNLHIDQDDNVFTRLKLTNHIQHDDAFCKKEDCQRLLIPGCHAAYSFPDLTKRLTNYLIQEDIIDGMGEKCCGNPLYASGLYKEFYAYVKKMEVLYKEKNVLKIITPCPSCFDFYQKIQKMGYLQNIEITSLSEELVKNNIKINRQFFPEDYTISIHDSCPDRHNGIFSSSIRELYKDFEIIELDHIKENTLCCGCGGLVPPYSQEIMKEGNELKKQEFEKVGSSCLITTCFNCYKGLKSNLKIHHYLEDLMGDKS